MAKFFKRLQAVGRSVGFMFVYPRAVIGNEQKEMEYATGRRFLFGWKPRAKRSGPSVADNGKSIGEVRDFEELNVQEFTNVANAFSMKLNYKKMWN